jgi:hypothetical protein
MSELELRQRQMDRRTYELEGFGTVHLERFRRATIEAAGRRLHVRESGWINRTDVTDDAGAEVGFFVRGRFGSPGTLRLGDREWSLRRTVELFRTRYELSDAGGELLASIRVRALWRPTLVEVPHETAVNPAALLIAVFVVLRDRVRAAAAA